MRLRLRRAQSTIGQLFLLEPENLTCGLFAALDNLILKGPTMGVFCAARNRSVSSKLASTTSARPGDTALHRLIELSEGLQDRRHGRQLAPTCDAGGAVSPPVHGILSTLKGLDRLTTDLAGDVVVAVHGIYLL